ncbi:MAG: UDP-N-acetylglucosamine 1-carboxyvinyltransferase [Bacillota bacterium]
MDKIVITGGTSLEGKITVGGAKNAVLPCMAATLLTEEPVILHDIPHLTDVITMCDVLGELGAKIEWVEDGNSLLINCANIVSAEAPYEYVRRMRASFLIMGPLLARTGWARMSMPGGCAIGSRPLDLHLKGMAALGAKVSIGHGQIYAQAGKLAGAKVYLDFPSVGATENIIMAASLTKGITIIENAAEEPEIVDLANLLNSMGARITGAGTNIIKVDGAVSLHGTSHGVIPDRIEAGTYMVAAAATGGNVLVDNVITEHLKPVVAKLKETGVEIQEEGSGVRVRSHGIFAASDIKTMPYPGFPTDMQAQMMAMMTRGQGTSVITETVFENRFMHVDELKRMGANIKIEGHTAVVRGVHALTGAPVKATDLRAGAALIIAGLVAQGETEITGIHHIQRGYDKIVPKLRGIGAQITLH